MAMFGITWHDTTSAIEDVSTGLASWHVWQVLAWNELVQRYRRTLVGTWWLTLSMAITIIAVGFVFSVLYGMDISKLLPSLTIGYIVWMFVTSFLNDGTTVFLTFKNFIHQAKRPFTIYVCWIVWRNLIVLGHNLLIFVGVALVFRIKPGLVSFLAIPGLFLVVLSLSWTPFLLGTLAARYRDTPPIVQSTLGVVFFVTPILFLPEQLGRFAWLAYINPVTPMLELVRDPLLGSAPPARDWIYVGLITLIGWTAGMLLFVRFRKRISYWL
jgi:homopolymeric O-antigen transport system permease protein